MNDEKKSSCNMRDWTLCILAVMVVGSFLAYGFIVILGLGVPLDPKERADDIKTFINFSWAAVGMALGFYFGSSKGSEDKNSNVADAISKMPNQPPSPPKEPEVKP